MPAREIKFDSKIYHQSLALRDLYLRQPLGLRLDAIDTEGEAHDRHFVLVEQEAIIGGLIARPATHQTIRYRQMWIDSAHSGKGHGRDLLQSVETILASEGTTCFTLHARESAREFYLKCGYQQKGDPFIEVGIAHIAMVKSHS